MRPRCCVCIACVTTSGRRSVRPSPRPDAGVGWGQLLPSRAAATLHCRAVALNAADAEYPMTTASDQGDVAVGRPRTGARTPAQAPQRAPPARSSGSPARFPLIQVERQHDQHHGRQGHVGRADDDQRLGAAPGQRRAGESDQHDADESNGQQGAGATPRSCRRLHSKILTLIAAPLRNVSPTPKVADPASVAESPARRPDPPGRPPARWRSGSTARARRAGSARPAVRPALQELIASGPLPAQITCTSDGSSVCSA